MSVSNQPEDKKPVWPSGCRLPPCNPYTRRGLQKVCGNVSLIGTLNLVPKLFLKSRHSFIRRYIFHILFEYFSCV